MRCLWTLLDRRRGRSVTSLSGSPEGGNTPQSPDAGADMYWIRVVHGHQKYRAARDAINPQEKVVVDMGIPTLLFNQSGCVSARRAFSVWSQFEQEFRGVARDGMADAPVLMFIHPDDAIVTLNAALRLQPRFAGRTSSIVAISLTPRPAPSCTSWTRSRLCSHRSWTHWCSKRR